MFFITHNYQIRFKQKKTLILRESLIKNNVKKRFNVNNRLNIFINVKRVFYEVLQKMFNKFIFLIYYNFVQQLYVDVNVSHKRDFKIIIYHVKEKKIIYNKKDIELILFLNKILTSVEFCY